MRYLLLVVVLLVAVGCSSTKSRVVGTWKVKDVKANSKDIGENLAAGLAGAFMRGMTFEFNDDNKVKVSMALGGDQSTYSIEGNEVVIHGDNKDSKAQFRFKMAADGKTMTAVKEFKSDPDIILEKVDSDQP